MLPKIRHLTTLSDLHVQDAVMRLKKRKTLLLSPQPENRRMNDFSDDEFASDSELK
jgi:hypothetical protein